MWGDAELQEWAEEQLAELERKKEEEKASGVKPKEPPEYVRVPLATSQPMEMRRVVRGGEALSERVWAGQELRLSFRVWANADGTVAEKEEDLTVERFETRGAKPISAHSVRYAPRKHWPDPVARPDDLDEWLQIPPPAPRPPWLDALDTAVDGAAEGELVLVETPRWRLEADVEAVLTEKEVVNPNAGIAAHGFKGFAKTKRAGVVPIGGQDDAESRKRQPRPVDGAVVRGEVRLVNGFAPAAWFGVQGNEWPAASSLIDDDRVDDDDRGNEGGAAGAWSSAPFEVTVGDGVACEALEAALVQSCTVGAVVRLATSGDPLLPDSAPDASIPEGEVVVELCVASVDDSGKREAMNLEMPRKLERAETLKARGSALYAAGRLRRAEAVWRDATKLFGFIKPEDSAFDPTDAHMKENEEGRKAAVPLLLNEALCMRKRGALRDAKTNLDEALDNAPDHLKVLFRRGQVLIDLEKWEDAMADFRKCQDLGFQDHKALESELSRLRKLQRKQDVKDGKYFGGAFDDDRDPIYQDKPLDPKRMSKARDELRKRAETLKHKHTQPGPSADPRGFTAGLKRDHASPAWDWTASYSTKDRPKLVSVDQDTTDNVVRVDDLQAELEDIDDDEEEARRQAKQDYYNTQIGLGNVRLQAPK